MVNALLVDSTLPKASVIRIPFPRLSGKLFKGGTDVDGGQLRLGRIGDNDALPNALQGFRLRRFVGRLSCPTTICKRSREAESSRCKSSTSDKGGAGVEGCSVDPGNWVGSKHTKNSGWSQRLLGMGWTASSMVADSPSSRLIGWPRSTRPVFPAFSNRRWKSARSSSRICSPASKCARPGIRRADRC